MIRPATYQTARLLAQGYQPGLLAKLEGVTPRAIHLRRQRFEAATGGDTIGRYAKQGRPRKGRSPAEIAERIRIAAADSAREARRKWEEQQEADDDE